MHRDQDMKRPLWQRKRCALPIGAAAIMDEQSRHGWLSQVSLQRACGWAQQLPPAKPSLPVSHAASNPSGAVRP